MGAYIYLLCKSYQGTRKIMQKKTQKREKKKQKKQKKTTNKKIQKKIKYKKYKKKHMRVVINFGFPGYRWRSIICQVLFSTLPPKVASKCEHFQVIGNCLI